jgi:hypothetical protein
MELHLNSLLLKRKSNKVKQRRTKKVREEALLIASEYQGTFLKSGREMSVQAAEKKMRSAIIIQQCIQTLHQHRRINHQQQE